MNNVVAVQPDRRSILGDMATRYGMEPAAFEATVRATCIKPDKNGRVATREEFAAFLLVAKNYNLNPLTKEIYAFTDNGRVIPIVGVDGWANLINSHPQFDGMRFGDQEDGKGGLSSITCSMFRKDRHHATEVTEYMIECKRDTVPWNKWPRRMLRHKSMIQAARYSFGFAGIYDPDEGERILEARNGNGHTAQRTPPAPNPAPRALTAPNPNKAAPAPPRPQQTATSPIDFDALRSALDACETLDAANALFEREVTDRTPQLSDDDLSECDAVLREVGAKFWEDEASGTNLAGN